VAYPYDGMFYPTLPEDTQDFGQVLAGVGRNLRDFGRGVSYLPMDLAGASADIGNLPLQGIDYLVNQIRGTDQNYLSTDRPFGGSAQLIDVATKLGLSQQPTGSAPETLGRVMAGLINPMAGARAVGRVGEITTEQANRAADALVRQITGNPEATAPAVLEAAGQMSPLAVYRKTTPTKPDPSVGTRFEREFLGGLAEKTPVKIEDLKGSSLMLMPWDSTNRNYKITSISDEVLPQYSITHGGQDYARDIEHIRQNIAGASNLDIAKRIQDRAVQGRIENLEAGGTGDIIPLPTTMGAGAENFSVQPTLPILGLLDLRQPSKAFIKYFDKEVQNFKVPKTIKEDGVEKRIITQPFKNFKGVMTEEGRIQLRTGEGLESTAGELRKAMTKIATKKAKGFEGGSNQEYLRYNLEDLTSAITDEALVGVPKGYAGNTVIRVGPEGMHLSPATNPTYSTNFSGQYLGTLGQSIPAEALFPKLFPKITQEMVGKKGDIRNMVLGALEKRKEGISEIVDQQVIDSVNEYLRQLNSGLLGP